MRDYLLIFVGLVAGLLLAMTYIFVKEPLNPPNSNYHCAHIYTEREMRNQYRSELIRFDSGIWWKGPTPIAFSLTEESDICVWQ